MIWIENLIKMSLEEIIGGKIGIRRHAKSLSFLTIRTSLTRDFIIKQS
jgi:hypothetical protein